jgi:hypothetical protein
LLVQAHAIYVTIYFILCVNLYVNPDVFFPHVYVPNVYAIKACVLCEASQLVYHEFILYEVLQCELELQYVLEQRPFLQVYATPCGLPPMVYVLLWVCLYVDLWVILGVRIYVLLCVQQMYAHQAYALLYARPCVQLCDAPLHARPYVHLYVQARDATTSQLVQVFSCCQLQYALPSSKLLALKHDSLQLQVSSLISRQDRSFSMIFFGLCQLHQVSLWIFEMASVQASSLIRVLVITVYVVLCGAQREVQHVARSSEQISLYEVQIDDEVPRFFSSV